jgi:flagellin
MQSENEEASRSSIMDLDVAAEMSRLVSSQVLRDLGVSMIAQANRMPQSLMKLFE